MESLKIFSHEEHASYGLLWQMWIRPVIVTACNEPLPDLELLDRILVAVTADSLDIVICLNKIDLVSRYAADKIAKPYRNAGY